MKFNTEFALKFLPKIVFELLISIYNWNQYRIRRGGVYWEKRLEIRKNWRLDLDELKDLQTQRLRYFLNHCKKKSPYYSDVLNNVDLNDNSSLSLIKKLSKNDLIEKIDSIVTIKSKDAIESYTGGTTGSSLKVWYRKDDLQERFAYLDEFRSIYGYKLGGYVAWFSGKHLLTNDDINNNTFYKDDFINNIRFFSTFHITKETAPYYLQSINDYGCKFIIGFPSSLYRICSYCDDAGVKFNGNIDVFFPTAETVTTEHRDVITRVLGCKVIDQYASSEGAPFVFECPEGNLHADITTGCFEVIDSSKNDGFIEGPVLVTSFQTRGTPLVRYDIGDVFRIPLNGHCNCSWNLPVIDSIAGRVDDYIQTPKNGQINLGNISNSTKGIPGILSFQLVQLTLHNITVRVVAGDSFDLHSQRLFLKALTDRLGVDVKLDLELTDTIETSPSGKFRMIKKASK